MKKTMSVWGFALVLTGMASAPLSAQVGEMNFPEGTVQHVVLANDIQWKPCPPNLPQGCEIAVMEGNPKESGLFTIRFKITGEFIMPPHTHPKDERVTVLQGKAYVAFGKGATKEGAKEFGPGDYYVNARNAIHTVWAIPSTIIQITGIGPWEASFIDE
ncbi:MAG: cupin domain-containing protein [Cyclobacteriaceae bacterium]|nr:cupin domain-containing protein [Cyclobacteriaceae bacterium]